MYRLHKKYIFDLQLLFCFNIICTLYIQLYFLFNINNYTQYALYMYTLYMHIFFTTCETADQLPVHGINKKTG